MQIQGRSEDRLESLTGKRDLPFPEYEDPPKDPAKIAANWLQLAHQEGVREPLAMALATRRHDGEISTRVVQPVLFDGSSLRIATHETSRKARDIFDTGSVGGLLYWRELGRQISISGRATRSPDCVADLVWGQRNPGYDGVSTISEQSVKIENRDVLIEALGRLDRSVKLPRPSRFVVFEVEIERYEFWSASSDRIHQRIEYLREGEEWHHEYLQP